MISQRGHSNRPCQAHVQTTAGRLLGLWRPRAGMFGHWPYLPPPWLSLLFAAAAGRSVNLSPLTSTSATKNARHAFIARLMKGNREGASMTLETKKPKNTYNRARYWLKREEILANNRADYAAHTSAGLRLRRDSDGQRKWLKVYEDN